MASQRHCRLAVPVTRWFEGLTPQSACGTVTGAWPPAPHECAGRAAFPDQGKRKPHSAIMAHRDASAPSPSHVPVNRRMLEAHCQSRDQSPGDGTRPVTSQRECRTISTVECTPLCCVSPSLRLADLGAPASACVTSQGRWRVRHPRPLRHRRSAAPQGERGR